MFFVRPAEQGGDGRRILTMRLLHYEQGLWPVLLLAARATRASPRPATSKPRRRNDRRTLWREAACARARKGELSRARQTLASCLAMQ